MATLHQTSQGVIDIEYVNHEGNKSEYTDIEILEIDVEKGNGVAFSLGDKKGIVKRSSYGRIIEIITNMYIAEAFYLKGEKSGKITLQNKRRNDIEVKPSTINSLFLSRTNNLLRAANSNVDKDEKYKPLQQLTAYQMAQLINHYAYAKRIALSSLNSPSEYDVIAIYNQTGEDQGIYTTSRDDIVSLINEFDPSVSTRYVDEVFNKLRIVAPRVTRETNRDLIPVGNGVFNYKTKTLEPHNPERVFLSKSPVNYVENPENPHIPAPDGSDYVFDIESWIADLSNEEGVPELLWQIIGACVRPMVSWDKCAFFFSTKGNNGKGTFCSFVRGIVGYNATVSLPIADMGKEFLLEPLIGASAIITDENDVGVYSEHNAVFKSIVTSDTLLINRKMRMPISYEPHLFMIQCLNDYPRSADKSDSLYRRGLMIPFIRNFTGRERKYIKKDFLQRQDVREYALWRVLSGMDDYYTLNQPAAVEHAIREFKIANDPIREFWDEFESDLAWDLIPYAFLYDLYSAWTAKTRGGDGYRVAKYKFIQSIVNIVESDPHSLFEIRPDNSAKHLAQGSAIRSKGRMDEPEMLIVEYKLKDWENKNPTKGDEESLAIPNAKEVYRGLIRKNSVISARVPEGL